MKAGTLNQKYVAFLRGINLGKRNIKMDDLCALFEAQGLSNVRSILASGNVLFDASSTPDPAKLSKALLDRFGFEIGVIVRSLKQLEALTKQNPFAKYEAGPDVKLYLTLCARDIGIALDGVENIEGDFDLVTKNPKEYFAVAYRQPSGRFGAGLDKLERLFKSNLITTRNWNTVLKIIKKGQQ